MDCFLCSRRGVRRPTHVAQSAPHGVTPPPKAVPAPPWSAVTIRPDPVDLGVIERGRPAEGSVLLQNNLSQPLALDRVNTSCPCIRFAPVPVTIGGGEAATLAVKFDPASDPEFGGGLGVEVVGYERDGREMFKTRVDLEVRPSGTGLPGRKGSRVIVEARPRG